MAFFVIPSKNFKKAKKLKMKKAKQQAKFVTSIKITTAFRNKVAQKAV